MLDKTEISPSPWHQGEVELQRLIGVAERMDAVGRVVVRDFMPDQHRAFYSQLPFIVIGSVDSDGAPWATIRPGQPGFLQSPDPRTLTVQAGRQPDDPADRGMEDGDSIGLLGIEPWTRRRNRLNGVVSRSSEAGFAVRVGQSFGNCPRYIHDRHVTWSESSAAHAPAASVVSEQLDEEARRIISAADTFFVASYVDRADAGRQVDVSHRGGWAGFVRIESSGALTVPDFRGNQFFNTLGNFRVNPRAGMLFVDHPTGGLLQLTGRVELILHSPEIADFEGAERLWRVWPEKIVHRPAALPLSWA